MFITPGRTEAEQMFAHADACMEYAREALAEGKTLEAERQVTAAQLWTDRARKADNSVR